MPLSLNFSPQEFLASGLRKNNSMDDADQPAQDEDQHEDEDDVTFLLLTYADFQKHGSKAGSGEVRESRSQLLSS
jgi:hypothetical protein